MLEDIAFQYVNLSERDLRLTGYAFVMAGATLAAIRHRSNAELQRAPYFVYLGLLILIGAAAQLVWFGSIQAMNGGFLWTLVLVDVVVGFCLGYALGVFAMARSRDAYGHAQMAFLAFIPFANLWLIIKSSKNEISPNRMSTAPLFKGGLGVLIGFVLLLGGISLNTFVALQMDRMVAEAEDDQPTLEMAIAMMLRIQGLEVTLHQIAAEMPSERIDETTFLLRVEGEGTTLRYIYEVSTDLVELPESIQLSLSQNNCSNQAVRHLIDAGAILEHIYMRRDGSEIGTVTVMRELCGS